MPPLIKPQAIKIFSGYLFVLFIFILLIDWVLQATLEHSDLMAGPTEINSPATLYAKIHALRNFKGIRIAVLGDSLVFGRSLQEHGIEPWRKNNLSANLSNEMDMRWPDHRIEVMNFGMNGVTPSELESILPLVMSARPDLILIDVTLRSFSRDFNDPAASSRAWLKTMTIDEQSGSLSLSESASLFETRIASFVMEHFFLYRAREIIQFRLLEARPKVFFGNMMNRVNSFFLGSSDTPRSVDNLVLQLKAQQRYAKVDLEGDNLQWDAYQRLVLRIKNEKQKALFFYATENPDILDSLMEERRYKSLINRVVRSTQIENQVLFIGPLARLTPENFLDHVHLTPSGYQILAKRLADGVVILLNPS